MIVKTLRHKRDRFHALVQYILTDKDRVNSKDFDTIYHNFHSIEPNKIIAEYKANDRFRKKRKNGVVAYHEILSFSPEDKPHITKDMLQKIAQEYIKLRGENALCLVQAHVENQNIHLHFLFSGNHYRSAQTLRLDNKNFRKVREGIEAFQRQHYPQLKASLVYERWNKKKDFSKERQNTAREKLFQMTHHREIQTTDKTIIARRMELLLIRNPSKIQLLQTIKQEPDITPYLYRGKTRGVIYKGKKYRFQRLGINWDQLPEKTKDKKPTKDKSQNFNRNR